MVLVVLVNFFLFFFFVIRLAKTKIPTPTIPKEEKAN